MQWAAIYGDTLSQTNQLIYNTLYSKCQEIIKVQKKIWTTRMIHYMNCISLYFQPIKNKNHSPTISINCKDIIWQKNTWCK